MPNKDTNFSEPDFSLDDPSLNNMARLLNYIASTCECERCSTYRYISEPYLYNKSYQTGESTDVD